MSKKTSPASESPAPFAAETQLLRWLKYGSNVALTSIVVVALAVLAVFLAQRFDKQVDMTSTGLYSLKPQTINIIKNNTQPIKIIAFYTTQKPPEAASASVEKSPVVHFDPAVEAQTVADLLQEYKKKGSNIQVECIDPNQNPARVDKLVDEVMNKYSGEIEAYKDFAAKAPAQYDSVKKLIEPGLREVSTLPFKEFKSQQLLQAVVLTLYSIQSVPEKLEQRKTQFEHLLREKVPDYKGVSDDVKEDMGDLIASVSMVMDNFKKLRDEPQLPAAVGKYMDEQLPNYQAIKTIADDLVAKAKLLGDLKLDKLRSALQQPNPIIVEGEHDWVVESYEAIWQVDQAAARQVFLTKGIQVHPHFAGEQVLTGEIYGLQMSKHPKVCFVRGGGRPLSWPQDYGGWFYDVAASLKRFHFDVSDKDLTGAWAVQSQGQAPPEPTEQEIKDAIWVVFTLPDQQNSMMGMGPSTIAPKVAEHLASGGAALIVTMSGGDNYQVALQDWGISIQTDALCMHDISKGTVNAAWYDQALRHPEVFQLSQYGDAELAKPLQSLNTLMARVSPVETSPVKGITNQAFLPIPDAPAAPMSWSRPTHAPAPGEAPPKYDPSLGDRPGPLYAAALAENSRHHRLAVYGTPTLLLDEIIEARDMDAPNQPLCFPGNQALFDNTIFWLAHQDELISISPEAMDVSRVSNMGPAAQVFWRYIVLLCLLPGLMLACGITVYIVRRD